MQQRSSSGAHGVPAEESRATMTSSELTVTVSADDLTVEMSRTFDAPRALVYEAHVKPGHIREWWGLRNSTMTTCDLDARPGGRWRFVSRETDGNEYAFFGEFLEVVPPARLVWTFSFEGMPDVPPVVETVTFEEHDGVTTLKTRSVYPSKEALEGMVASGMEEGAGETWDRLAEYLRTLG
jgi:uncharacterized protein YndB with AHSA1/START domain